MFIELLLFLGMVAPAVMWHSTVTRLLFVSFNLKRFYVKQNIAIKAAFSDKKF